MNSPWSSHPWSGGSRLVRCIGADRATWDHWRNDNLAGWEDRVDEHYFADWKAYPSMVEVEPGKFVLPEAPERLPLLFTLTARK